MYPNLVVSKMIFEAEHELRILAAERRRQAIENGTWSVRRPSTRSTLRRRAGDALVTLGERLRGTTIPTASTLEPATR